MAIRKIAAASVAMLLFLSPPAALAAVEADVSNSSTSLPKLNGAGNDWEAFGPLIAHPNSGKTIVVRFVPNPTAVVNLSSTGMSSVTLRPASAPAPAITCTESNVVPPPVPPGVDPTSVCFYRIDSPGTTFADVHISYFGILEVGDTIRYTISDLGAGVDTFTNFDSDTVIGPDPTPSSVGRVPVRLAVVLDKSGSMAWSSNPSAHPECALNQAPTLPVCQPDRWTVLEQAFGQFTSVADAYKLMGDQFAVVVFDDDVDDPADIVTAFGDAGAPVYVPMTASNLSNALNEVTMNINPGGSTSIGAGVATVVNGGPSDPDDPLENAAHRNMLLLFTDGAQNRSPFIELNPMDSTELRLRFEPGPTFETLATPQTETSPAAFNICPFAMVADDPAGFGPIADIANVGCSNFYFLAPSLQPDNSLLIEYLIDVLNQTLLGDKLETVAVENNRLTSSGGEPPLTTLSVDLGADNVAATFLLKWARAGNDVRDVVLRKDGVDFVVSTAGQSSVDVRRGPDFINLTVRAPFCNASNNCVNPAGTWELVFRPIFEVAETFDYSFLTLVDNSSLATEFAVSQPTEGVGEPISLQVQITEAGAPVTGLPAGAVVAVVTRPDSGLGNVLSDAKVDLPDPGQLPDPIQGSGLKFNEMLRDPALRSEALGAILASNQTTVQLTESSPGVYSGQMTDTAVEGTYEIRFLVEANAPSNGPIKRTRSQTYNVPVVPASAATLATVVVTALPECGDFPGGCSVITVRPVDALGNRLGPGKAFGFRVTGFDGVQLDDVVDNLDGSYSVEIGCNQASDCSPTIAFGKYEVGSVDAGQAPGILELILKYWWLILLIILLLLLYFFVIKK